MSKSIIKACTCTSDFQDNLYGKKMRVHNITEDGKKASCTVCEGSAKMAKRNNALNRKGGDLITANRKSKSI
jgi:hypothetical protein